MKLLSADQFAQWDQATINQGIASIDLMERAAAICAQEIMIQHHHDEMFLILCGMGNNGGDGLAITRILHQQGYAVKAAIVKHREEFTIDAAYNLHRLKEINPDLITEIQDGYQMQELPDQLVIIDALFGTGFRGKMQDWLASFIKQLNALRLRVVAIDMPSGLSADEAPSKDAAVVIASQTLTFQAYKRIMLHAEGEPYLGKIQVLDIGLNADFNQKLATPYSLLGMSAVRQWIKPLSRFAHKGSKGTAQIAAGSEGMCGAALLATKGALRSGAGKAIIHTSECNVLPLQITIPEAIIKMSGKKMIQRVEHEDNHPLLFGSGVGMGAEMQHTLRMLIEQRNEPMVLDADALNLLAEEPSQLHKLPKNSILTPHVKEYERMFGTFKDSMLRLENARTQAMKFECIIVLKGHYTQIVTPKGHVWYNTTGNAGMATAGSGDVLAGMLCGLLAQGYEPLAAAMLGVFLHGLAGDEAAEVYGYRSVLAGDIVENIGNAWKRISG